MSRGSTPSMSPDSGADSDPDAQHDTHPPNLECQILRKMRNKLKRHPELWLGNPLTTRDHRLLYCRSVDFFDASRALGTCYAQKLTFFLPREEITPVKRIEWKTEDDFTCKMFVQRCGGKVFMQRSPQIPYPDHLKPYHMRIDVKIILPTPAAIKYKVAWGVLSTTPDKAHILQGPSTFTPSHPWDAMILYDCHITLEGELRNSPQIASRVYDILLMKMGPDYIFPWLPVAIRDVGPFENPGDRIPECYPRASPQLPLQEPSSPIEWASSSLFSPSSASGLPPSGF
ncbi:hypothetical protein F5B19DRAFT_492996 [Rostrohypoxylon terebratum]|nr:hypothetical protein F5B19DRAFT_492996 [Rostrohypoxylon terebratum]